MPRPSEIGASEGWPLVAIVGRPNVGKSTLFNRLCGGHEAIAALRKLGKPILWAANKVDNTRLETEAQELYSLGADEVFPLSAQHGRGMAELCDAIVARLPDAPRLVDQPEEEDDASRPI